MPSFSFTAPIITEEEEKKEREGLDDIERSEIQRDIYGCNTETVQKIAVDVSPFSYADFQKALETIAIKEKKDLLEALDCVPELVQEESNPEYFFRCCSSIDDAARRVAQYWKHRRKLFGNERAFKPMTLDGAMQADVETLQKCLFSVLPRDQAGRAVIFFDRIRAIPAVASREDVCRVLFFILQKVTAEESTQQNGFVMIENIVGYDLYTHFDRLLTKSQMSLIGSCFPSKLRCYHVCAGKSGKWAVDLIMPVMKQMAGRYIRLRTVCHTGCTLETLADLENNYNFSRKSLSDVIGGEIPYAYQLCWISRLMEQETQPGFGPVSPIDEDELVSSLHKSWGDFPEATPQSPLRLKRFSMEFPNAA